MAPIFVEGLTVTFQGYLCAPLFEFNRSAGLEPDFGFVLVPKSEFKNFKIKEVDVGTGLTRDKAAKPEGGGFETTGALVIREAVRGAGGRDEVHEVVAEGLLLSERAVESFFTDDEGDPLCKVELTDIRALWGSRGVVFGWFNVPLQGAGAQKFSKGEARTRDASTAPPPGDEVAAYVPGSLRNGKPWTLRQVLEERVLPKLHGRPRLVRVPEALAGFVPTGHVWNGALAKQALADLLAEAQTVLALNLDGTVSLWLENEGPLGEVGGGRITYDPSSPNVDPRVSDARRLAASFLIPNVVLVLGGPVIETARERLEAVGELAGEVVPLAEALAGIGLSLAQARRLAVLPHEKRAAFAALSEDGLREFEKWAFRWFRVPGGAEKSADRLPILDARGAAGDAGELLPMRAFSETFTVVNTISAVLAQLEAKGSLQVANGAQRRITDQVLDAIEKAPKEHFRQVVNLPFREIPGQGAEDQARGNAIGFEVDRARGIVRFASIQGHAEPEGDALEVASLAAKGPRVELEYAYERKPSLDTDVLLEHRTFTAWKREGSGPSARVVKLPTLPTEAIPLVIERPDLQEVRSLGESNRVAVERLSEAAAAQVLRREPALEGAVVTFARFVAVQTTGLVRSVTWQTANDELPTCVAHVGFSAPLAPSPTLRPRSRAFGVGESLAGAVMVPKGVAR